MLPDDVFENMKNASVQAQELENTVTEFNKTVDERFKNEDKNVKNKVADEKVKPILNSVEKLRYKNIGAAFFDGAKNTLLDIFKKIEADKKKGFIKRTFSAVADKVEAIKDSIKEASLMTKILGAVGAIGLIYFLFKDWFDKNLPPIWEKIKEGFELFQSGFNASREIIANFLKENNIVDTMKTFFNNTLGILQNFFNSLYDEFKNLFSDEEIISKGEEAKLHTTAIGREDAIFNIATVDTLGANVNDLIDYTVNGKEAGETLDKIGKERTTQVLKFIQTGAKKLTDSELKKLQQILSDGGNIDYENNEFLKQLHDKIKDLFVGTELFGDRAKDIMENNSYAFANMIRAEADRRKNVEEAKIKEETERAKKRNEQLVTSASSIKLVDVAVITTLNEYTKKFFGSDEPGSFKNFASNFVTMFSISLDNIKAIMFNELGKISDFIIQKISLLTNNEKLIEILNKLEALKTTTVNNSTGIKNVLIGCNNIFNFVKDIPEFVADIKTNNIEQLLLLDTSISNKLGEERKNLRDFIEQQVQKIENGGAEQYFSEIVNCEQKQLECLSEQLNTLRATNSILGSAEYFKSNPEAALVPIAMNNNASNYSIDAGGDPMTAETNRMFSGQFNYA